MFCSQCGNKLNQTDKFCSKCGEPIKSQENLVGEKELAVASSENQPVEQMETDSTGTLKKWIVPLGAAALVTAGLAADYTYQTYTNKKVEEWREQGEKFALAGDIEGGREKIQLALNKRPDATTLQNDLKILNDASSISKKIEEAHELTNNRKFTEALEKIEQAKKDLQTRKGNVYGVLTKKVQKEEATTTVAQIKSEMSKKKTMEELVSLLTRLDGFTDDEAKKVKSSITEKIATLAYTDASKALNRKDFTAAINIVDKALKYDSQNKKLMSFKDTVKKKRASFERAEQQKMEMAIEAAAKEEMKNRTQAVELLSLNSRINDTGDFEVFGEVRNVATRQISSIRMYYDIVDSTGTAVYSGMTYVYPYLLDIGEAGSFVDTQYNTGDMSSARITGVEWILN